MNVIIEAEPEPVEIEVSKTAVLVVDMQNAFVRQGGYFDLIGHDIMATGRIINPFQEINSLPLAISILNTELIETSITELRQKIGPDISGEEFLIRLTLPSSEVEDMLATDPIKTIYP